MHDVKSGSAGAAAAGAADERVASEPAANAYWCLKVLGLLLRRRLVRESDITEDYDRVSASYDDCFLRRIEPHSVGMVERLGLTPGARVLDLACGTGALTLAAARLVGEGGAVIGVDRSAGMLAKAEQKRKRAGLGNVWLVRGGMMETLDEFPDSSFDAVTCGWAIGYVKPAAFLRAAAAKLKRGGRMGIIENARGTLAPVHDTALKVTMAMPGSIQALMSLPARLPEDAQALRGLFRKAGLSSVEAWEGSVPFEFRSGSEVLAWVLGTGASAGFDRMMRPERRGDCDRLFMRLIERDHMRGGRIVVKHRYVAGIAVK